MELCINKNRILKQLISLMMKIQLILRMGNKFIKVCIMIKSLKNKRKRILRL